MSSAATPARLQGEVARALAVRGDVALDDSSALADPRVARFQVRGEVVIGHHPLWEVAACTDNSRINH
jgi:hypothetical protein